MNKKLAIIFVMLLTVISLFAYTVLATGVFGTRTPATLFQTTNTTINFSIVVNSTNINMSKNMTVYLMISNNSDGDTYNSNISTFNLTNNVTNNTVFSVLVPGFKTGFHSWFVNIEDLNGNTSSQTSWFEITTDSNTSLFVWKNNSGNDVMTLNKNNGNLTLIGNLSVNGIILGNTASFPANLSIGGELNMTGNNITDVYCIRFVSGGMICTG